jgi:hypothetical protein
VGPEELGLYSYCIVYRLRHADRLNQERLREFADHGCQACRHYSFKSWLGFNDNLLPSRQAEISAQYTCSTMVAAAYHYAGVTLEIVDQKHRVITPLSISASVGRLNQFALPEPPADRLAAPLEISPVR